MFLNKRFKQSDLEKETFKSFKRKYTQVFNDNSQDIKAFFDEEYKKL